jgi:hypothetical protein
LNLKKMQQQYKLNRFERLAESKCDQASVRLQPSFDHSQVSHRTNDVKPQTSQQPVLTSAKYLRTPTKGGSSLRLPAPISQNALQMGDSMDSLIIFKPKIDRIKPEPTPDAIAKSNPRNNIRPCVVTLTRFDEKLLKNGVFRVNPTKENEQCRTALARDVRKLRVKSKTFPRDTIKQPPENLDEILPVSASSNTVAGFSSNKRSGSRNLKLRTSSFGFDYSLVQPSPAELLRKYATIKGHVCEMDNIFKGSSITLTECLECENLTRAPEAFYDRSLPINTNFEGLPCISVFYSLSCLNCLADVSETSDLDWILRSLRNESFLDQDSKYMCNVCMSKQDARIYTQYLEMPSILVLHLLSYGITSRSVDT